MVLFLVTVIFILFFVRNGINNFESTVKLGEHPQG